MKMERSVGLVSVANARQLGGLRTNDDRIVRENVLIRSGHTAKINESDTERLKSVFHLSDIVDFRTSAEMKGQEDPPIEGVTYHHVSIISEDELSSESSGLSAPKDTPEGLMLFLKTVDRLNIFHDSMYIDFLETETGKSGYRRFFEILLAADDDSSVLWHCASGKDRTGLAAMLILSCLNVDEETIIRDYMLTNEYNAERIRSTRQFILDSGEDSRLAENIALFGGVHERYLTIALNHLKTEYGSPLGYIKKALTLSDKDIRELRSKFLIRV